MESRILRWLTWEEWPGSDCGRSGQFHCLRVCSGGLGHSPGCSEHNSQVCLCPFIVLAFYFLEVWRIRRDLHVLLECSAILAHIVLKERLHLLGILGCMLCIVGSTTIVLHAPQERTIESVKDVWILATEPGNLNSEVETSCNSSLMMRNARILLWATVDIFASLYSLTYWGLGWILGQPFYCMQVSWLRWCWFSFSTMLHNLGTHMSWSTSPSAH